MALFEMRYAHCGYRWGDQGSSVGADECPICSAQVHPHYAKDLVEWTVLVKVPPSLEDAGPEEGAISPVFAYKNSNYARVEGLTREKLEAMLRRVFDKHPEYHDTAYGSGLFEDMVTKFANDEFYKYHYVAQQYLRLHSPSLKPT